MEARFSNAIFVEAVVPQFEHVMIVASNLGLAMVIVLGGGWVAIWRGPKWAGAIAEFVTERMDSFADRLVSGMKVVTERQEAVAARMERTVSAFENVLTRLHDENLARKR